VHLLARLVLVLGALTSSLAIGQPDTRPIRVLVGFPTGGAPDVVARILAERMRELLDRPIVVENRPGNGGQVAAVQLRNATPDGTTVMLTIDHTQVTLPLTYREPGYDPLKDFTPLAGVAQYANAMAAGAKTGIRSLKDLAAWMRDHPEQHNFGIPAAGSIPHFAGLLVGSALNLDLMPVPYKGGHPLVQDLLGGQVPIGLGALPELIEHHRGGRLRVLAVSGARRARAAPDIPTFRELGIAGLDRNSWLAYVGPAGLPPAYVTNFNAAVRNAMLAPEVRERFGTLGIELAPTQPEDLRQWVEDDLKHWGPVIRDSGVVLQ
jgi:tripartite-type tricarboxylate transporter receptor subunit TctC